MASRSAKLENQFVGEGYYDLCLRIGELIQLQEILKVGPSALGMRFLQGEWMVQDIIQVIRLGLIGGGMHSKDAFDLANRVIVEGYLGEYAALAGQVVFAAMSGVEDEELPGNVGAPTTGPTPTKNN